MHDRICNLSSSELLRLTDLAREAVTLSTTIPGEQSAPYLALAALCCSEGAHRMLGLGTSDSDRVFYFTFGQPPQKAVAPLHSKRPPAATAEVVVGNFGANSRHR